LVATEDEIAQAQAEAQAPPVFLNAEQAGMSDQEFADYQRAVQDAQQEAVDELTRQVMSELSREQKAWWRQEREKVRAEVEAEVNAQPVYRALSILQFGKLPDGSPLPEGVEPIKL